MGDGTGCDNMTCIIVVFNRSSSGNKRAADELDVGDVIPAEKRLKLDSDADLGGGEGNGTRTAEEKADNVDSTTTATWSDLNDSKLEFDFDSD